MKLSTVAEALASEIDEPVLGIKGVLTKLYDPMTGDGEHGPWSIQNGMIKDKTGEIKVMFSSRDAIPKMWRGKEIVLQCQKGNRGGWSGVKIEADKKEKDKLVLKVTASAEVFLFQGDQPEPEQPAKAPAKASTSPQEPPQPAPKVNTAPAAQTAPRPPDEAANLAEGRARIYEILNTQLAVITQVHEYLVPAVKQRTGQTIDAQQEAALVQNCLIQMYFEKSHHFFAKRPYKVGEQPQNGT